MGRHTTITDKQILDAAREVFVEEGFGVKTATIAVRAGVSEGTIFKRYPTKEALFFAALEIEQHPAWHKQTDRLIAEWEGKDGLVSLFVSILNYLSEIMPRMITAIGSRVGMPPKPFEGMSEDPRKRDQRVLSQFLQKAIDAGHLRSCNAETLAQILIGAAVESTFDTMFDKRQRTLKDFRPQAERIVDVLWNGIKSP